MQVRAQDFGAWAGEASTLLARGRPSVGTAPSAQPQGSASRPGLQLEREPRLPAIVCVGPAQCVPAVT